MDSESVSEDFESVDETVSVPASPSSAAPLVPDYLPPATPLVFVPLPVAAVPTVTQPLYVSPVFPVKAQPRTVSTISLPKPARIPRQRSTSRRPKTTVPLTHPGQSPVNFVVPPPPLPSLLFLIFHPNPVIVFSCMPLLLLVMLCWFMSMSRVLCPLEKRLVAAF